VRGLDKNRKGSRSAHICRRPGRKTGKVAYDTKTNTRSEAYEDKDEDEDEDIRDIHTPTLHTHCASTNVPFRHANVLLNRTEATRNVDMAYGSALVFG
jgi:hypothetical protein